MNQAPEIVDVKFLADFFAKDIRTIQRWAKEEDMPRETRGQYNFLAVVKWRIKLLDKKVKDLELGDETLYQEKRETARLINAKKRIELARQEKKYLDADAVQAAWTNETVLFRKNGDGLKANLERELTGIVPEEKKNQAREIIRKEVNAYLNLLGTLDIQDLDEEFTDEFEDEE